MSCINLRELPAVGALLVFLLQRVEPPHNGQLQDRAPRDFAEGRNRAVAGNLRNQRIRPFEGLGWNPQCDLGHHASLLRHPISTPPGSGCNHNALGIDTQQSHVYTVCIPHWRWQMKTTPKRTAARKQGRGIEHGLRS